eukprot:g8249.t1
MEEIDMQQDGSVGSLPTQSDSETETDTELKPSLEVEVASETTPSETIPESQDTPLEEKLPEIDDISEEAARAINEGWENQSWHWERRWVEIERIFVSEQLSLLKWVKVPDKGNKISKTRSVTVERGKDGRKILVGGFMQYYCPHPGCGKVFPAVGSLRKHMHIHGEKQFVCTFENCGKRFLDNSKLKRHMAIHFKDN